MSENNPFLHRGGAATFSGGGGGMIENPQTVENIVFQTRAAPLDEHEAALARDLMQVFDGGATELADVVSGLNAAGSTDAAGSPWNEQSLTAQLKSSGDALFAPIDGDAPHA